MAFDGDQARKNKVEYHRIKFLYEPWGIYASVMIYAHRITYKQGEALERGTGDA